MRIDSIDSVCIAYLIPKSQRNFYGLQTEQCCQQSSVSVNLLKRRYLCQSVQWLIPV